MWRPFSRRWSRCSARDCGSRSDEPAISDNLLGNATAVNVATTHVRGATLRLASHTRALELCARMNRETEILDFIDECAPGSILYDLGACEGRFAIYAALRGIRCYAFEPEALNFQTLLENMELNGAEVRRLLAPLNYAVGRTSQPGTIGIGQPWAGGHHRVVKGTGRVDLTFAPVLEQEIEIVSLDGLIGAGDLPPPDYLKVDVDGSELAFIEGSAATLRREELKAIIFELSDRDDNYGPILNFLNSCGFAISRRYEIEPNLFNVWFKRRGRERIE
jgi:FkbM family methyltransferase